MADYQKPADRMKEVTDKLEQGIQDLFSSEKYAAYLKTMSKFYNYSFNNTLLIYMQRPDASLVAGYGAWQKNFSRQVKRGEHGIKILAPSPYKAKMEMERIDPATNRPMIGGDGKPVTEEVEIQRAAFRPVTVFDVSQTDGKELPALGVNELTGDVENYAVFFNALKETAPVPIGFEHIANGAKGYFHGEEQRIAIQEGMSEIQTVKTAIHEIAHATLHNYHADKEKDILPEDRKDRRTKEVEAESVAYTVCQHYGIDTSDYSFAYVAGWSSGRDTKELKSSMELIRATAAGLIGKIDSRVQELTRQQGQEKPADLSRADSLAWDVDLFMRQYLDGYSEIVKDIGKDRQQIADTLANDENKRLLLWSTVKSIGDDHPDLQAQAYALADQIDQFPDSFTIYQLKSDAADRRDLAFESIDAIHDRGFAVNADNYNRIYTAPLAAGVTLENIYEKFNLDHPEDFHGHSLSVSDVVVLHQAGRDTAHYCDSFGFTEVPVFLEQEQSKTNPLETAEKSTEQNYNMIDGQLNNTPPQESVQSQLAALEAKTAAGEPVSVLALAKAVKEEKCLREPEKPRSRKPKTKGPERS